MENQNVKKIFIVDDDSFYLEIIKHEILKMKNIEVETFTSAEECLLRMKIKPDLIVLDFYLDSVNPSNMTGHQALNTFFTKNPKVKILFISGTRNEFLLEEYKKYRSVDFMLKTSNANSDSIRQKILSCLNAA